MRHEIIFYNGFNLLVDILLVASVWFIAYRSGNKAGYDAGLDEGYQEGYHENWAWQPCNEESCDKCHCRICEE